MQLISSTLIKEEVGWILTNVIRLDNGEKIKISKLIEI